MTASGPQLRHLGIATDYAELHQLLRDRQAELKMSFETLNAISGLSYADKLLAPNPLCGPTNDRTATDNSARQSARGIGPLAWGPLLGALGVVLIVAEDPAATARIKARSSYRPRSDAQVNASSRSIDQLLNDRMRKIQDERLAIAREERHRKLSPAVRKAIARRAARARWRRRKPSMLT